MLWRHTPSAQRLVDAFLAYKPTNLSLDDQSYWNAFLAAQPATPKARVSLPFLELGTQCGVWGNLSMQVLPPALYGTQRHIFEFHLPQDGGELPYIIHFNWLSGPQNKMEAMKQRGLWLLAQ